MVNVETILKDLVNFVINLARTYGRLALTPWKARMFLQEEGNTNIAPHTFLLAGSFLFTINFTSLGSSGVDLGKLGELIGETSQSQFEITELLLLTAPVFFTAVFVAVFLSYLLGFAIRFWGPKIEFLREVRTLIWYTVGFQFLTMSLLLLLPALASATSPHQDWRLHRLWPTGDSLLSNYIFWGQPLLVGGGFAFYKYESQPGRAVWRLVVKNLLGTVGVAASILYTFGVALTVYIYVLDLKNDVKPRAKIPARTEPPVVLAHGLFPNGRSIRIDTLPDGSGVVRLAPIVYNSSDYPIYFDHTFGIFTPGGRLEVVAELDTISGFGSLVIIPPKAVKQVSITSECDTACMFRLQNNHRFIGVIASYWSPENRFRDFMYSRWFEIDREGEDANSLRW
jgi:hypothetical protein